MGNYSKIEWTDAKNSSLPGGNEFCFDGELGRFRNLHGQAELLVLTQKVRIVVCERFDVFPGEKFVVARRNSSNQKVSILVGYSNSIKIPAIPLPIRYQHGLNAADRLSIFAVDCSIDLLS